MPRGDLKNQKNTFVMFMHEQSKIKSLNKSDKKKKKTRKYKYCKIESKILIMHHIEEFKLFVILRKT